MMNDVILNPPSFHHGFGMLRQAIPIRVGGSPHVAFEPRGVGQRDQPHSALQKKKTEGLMLRKIHLNTVEDTGSRWL